MSYKRRSLFGRVQHGRRGPVLVIGIGLVASGTLAQPTADPSALLRRATEERKAGNYPRAIDTGQQALQAAHASGNVDLEWVARGQLGLTHNLAGDPQQALQLHEQNLAFVRQHPKELVSPPLDREVDSLQAIAADYATLSNLAKAAELLTQALSTEEQHNPGDQVGFGKAKLTQKLGTVQFVAGDSTQAEKTLLASLAAFEAALKVRLATGGLPPVDEYEAEVEVIRWLQAILVAHNRTDEALAFAEKGRSRAFAGLLAGRLGAKEEPLKVIRTKDAATVAPRELQNALTLSEMKEIAAAQRSTLVEYSVLYKYDPWLTLQFSGYTKIPATDLLIWLIRPTGEIVFRRERSGAWPRVRWDVRWTRSSTPSGTSPRARSAPRCVCWRPAAGTRARSGRGVG